MKILLTNDDGITSQGIQILEEELKKFGEVFVVAPKTQQSAKACSTNAFEELSYCIIDNHHISVEGTPVDCVEVGLALLNTSIDLIVSGCNDGYNLSQYIMYSGTCGACVQAVHSKKRAIAFSIKSKDYFWLLKSFIAPTMDYILKHSLLSNQYFLNVNFPIEEAFKGFKITKIYPTYEQFSAITNDNKCQIVRNVVSISSKDDSDRIAVKQNYISITPLKQNMFNEKIYAKVKNKLK